MRIHAASALLLVACGSESEPSEEARAARYAVELSRASAVFAACHDTGIEHAALFLTGGTMLVFGYYSEAHLRDYVSCLASVETGCTGAYACGMAHSAEAECQPGCEDDVFVICSDTGTLSVDCTKFGGVCGGGQCRPPGAMSCGFPGTICEGDLIVACVSTVGEGYVEKVDCAAFGGQCVGGSGLAQCLPPEPIACTEDTCGENGVVYCTDGVVQAGGNCPAELSCQLLPSGGDAHAGCGLGSACDSNEPPTCNGAELQVCVLGLRSSVDCTTLGFTGCSTSDIGPGCTP